jgi:hypothetical protein
VLAYAWNGLNARAASTLRRILRWFEYASDHRQIPARSGIPLSATFSLPWIRRALRFENTHGSRQRRFYAIETIIQMLREKNILGSHHYQLHGDQEDAGFKQKAVAEALDEKSDDEQNERCNDNYPRYDVELS